MRIHLVLVLMLALPAAVAGACPGQTPLSEPSSEAEVIRCHLSSALRGNADSIAAIVRLADGHYIDSAEGGEFLNATFMDLLIAHPHAFLSVVDAQAPTVKARVIRELNQPVHDAYSAGDLLAAVRLAMRQGLGRPFIADLETSYAESTEREHASGQRPRDELERAAAACLGGRSSDRACFVATAKARQSLALSPHDPVLGAISVDLADFVGGARAGEIFVDAYFTRWACNAAALYHHAMAQYERYARRSRDAFARVCPEQAPAPASR